MSRAALHNYRLVECAKVRRRLHEERRETRRYLAIELAVVRRKEQVTALVRPVLRRFVVGEHHRGVAIDRELRLARPLMFAEVLRLREKTLAVQDLREITLVTGKPHEIAVELAAPTNAVPGEVFQVHLEQSVGGLPTGGYTFVIVIAKPA